MSTETELRAPALIAAINMTPAEERRHVVALRYDAGLDKIIIGSGEPGTIGYGVTAMKWRSNRWHVDLDRISTTGAGGGVGSIAHCLYRIAETVPDERA